MSPKGDPGRARLLTELSGTELVKDGPVAVYYQIKQVLLRHIARCNDGQLFPTESELCRIFDVSRPTVRQAIAELVQEERLARTPGKGTFVKAGRVSRDLRLTFQTFDYELKSIGHTGQTEIRAFECIRANAEISAQLGVEAGAKVYRLARLRTADGSPLMTVVSYLPAHVFPGLEECVEQLVTLRRTLEDRYRVRFQQVQRRVEARSAGNQAELLDVAQDSPVLFIETHAFVEARLCVEYSTAWYRGDRSSFVIDIDRDSTEMRE